MEIPKYMYSSVEEESDYTMICHITDWHIGYIINNCNGNNFNWEIANERINKYISECKKYIELYNIRQVLVISTGDMIENSYMRETQAHNCEFLQSMQIHKAKTVPERRGKIMMGDRKGEEYVTPQHDEICFKMSKSAKQL